MLPAVGGGLLGLGLLASGFSVSSGGSSNFGSDFLQPRYKPIAIPPRACPALKVVQVTAAAAEALLSEPSTKLGSPAADRRFAAALAPLDFSLRATAIQVPERLQVELAATARQVEIGRALIAYRQGGSTSFLDAVFAGAMSLSNASDLVGHACGFPLMA
jgi:hypothetical protein